MRKHLLFGILLANIAIILLLWWNGSGALLSEGSTFVLLAFGRLLGLFAVFLVLLQVLFMARARWLESVFGLDGLSRFHHTVGTLSLLAIIGHPVALAFAYGRGGGVSFWGQLMRFLTQYEEMTGAFFAVVVFCAVVVYSLFMVRRRWNYEWWYGAHLLTYAAILGAFGHQLELGGDFTSTLSVAYWYLLYAIAFGALLLWRFATPLWRSWRHGFSVERVIRESPSTVSLVIRGAELERYPARAGQFVLLRILDRSRWWQSHPFSISQLPENGTLRITVRELGDYTKALAAVAPGTRVFLEGPYGVFTDHPSVGSRVALIAGGIGITPLLPLARSLAERGADVVLVYSNRAPDDVPLRADVEALPSGVRTQFVMSDTGGQLSDAMLRNLIPDIASRTVFLCGPPAMTQAVERYCRMLDVPHAHIHTERFSFGA